MAPFYGWGSTASRLEPLRGDDLLFTIKCQYILKSWFTNYNQYIQNYNKLCLKAINYGCFKLEEKATRGVEKNKNNFINVIGDKFVISIR